MFFSIIIPTYNPKKYLPTLLTSITTNKCIDDIEIIISDDCSTENFDDIIKQFNQLYIRKIVNDKHYGFPRNGRQNGMDNAKGNWICFADQDDYFIDGIFDDIKEYIIKNNIKNCLYSNFIEQLTTDKLITRSYNTGWTHGKFYEKIFLEKYNIKYKEVKYHEDTSFTLRVDCIYLENKIGEIATYDTVTYIWKHRKGSLSSDIDYFVNGMVDYVKVTCEIIIEYVEKYRSNCVLFFEFGIKFISSILSIYFGFQADMLKNADILKNKEIELKKAIDTLKIHYIRFKEITQFTDEEFINFVYNELKEVYEEIRRGTYSQIPFIEKMTFQDWVYTYLK